MLINSRFGPPHLERGPPLGTISMDLAVCIRKGDLLSWKFFSLQKTKDIIIFLVNPKCSIFRVENDYQINGLSFEAKSISEDGLTYEWSRIRDGHQSVLLQSGTQNNGLESYLTLNPLEENIGTYTCRVKNSAGADISCEIEVQQKKGTYRLDG